MSYTFGHRVWQGLCPCHFDLFDPTNALHTSVFSTSIARTTGSAIEQFLQLQPDLRRSLEQIPLQTSVAFAADDSWAACCGITIAKRREGVILATSKHGRARHYLLDPENKTLRHASIESAEMLNLYSGTVTTDAQGRAVVPVADWFTALNADIRYQLTVAGGDDDEFVQAKIARELQGGQFVIRTSRPGVKVFWQLIGTRQDAYARAHPLVVEEDKPAAQRGYYLNPQEHGQPAERGVNCAPIPEAPEPLAGDEARRDLQAEKERQLAAQQAEIDSLRGRLESLVARATETKTGGDQ